MTKNPRLLALVIALSVNAGALAAIHTAMGQIAVHEQAARSVPERIVVTAHRAEEIRLANRSCPAPSVL